MGASFLMRMIASLLTVIGWGSDTLGEGQTGAGISVIVAPSVVERAYDLLSIPAEDRTPENARYAYMALIKKPLYQESEYEEPQVRALVARIRQDLRDALAVIQHKNAVPTVLPSLSPLDQRYYPVVEVFLDLVGRYTRLMRSSSVAEYSKTVSAQALRTFLEMEEYEQRIRPFLSQEPVFDFSMLDTTADYTFYEISEKLEKLRARYNELQQAFVKISLQK